MIAVSAFGAAAAAAVQIDRRKLKEKRGEREGAAPGEEGIERVRMRTKSEMANAAPNKLGTVT